MKLHHSKHHATYVTNLNGAIERRADAMKEGDLATVVQCDAAIKFNGGGHVNHTIFWTNLCPVAESRDPQGDLLEMINYRFGSVANFKNLFASQTAAVQGSGWGWLVYSPDRKGLEIVTTQNQDPVGALGLVPLLGVDVWEHAYYLKYENRRPEYLKEIWKVVNWDNVEERLAAALK